MQEFQIMANIYMTIQADKRELAWQTILDWFHTAPFPIEIDTMDFKDEYQCD